VVAELSEMPRRGTPAFRRWMWRALAIGALPTVTALLGVATMRAFDLMPGGDRLWTDMASFLAVGLVVCGILGFLAILDARTRVSGVVTVLAALVLNPFTAALVRAGLGIG